jgi:hypothetical protein
LVEHFKLNAQFSPDYVQHSFHVARNQQKVTVVQKWSKQKLIGQGGFGAVWLEAESGGQLRAVKVSKFTTQRLENDYMKELIALAKLSKVWLHQI